MGLLSEIRKLAHSPEAQGVIRQALGIPQTGDEEMPPMPGGAMIKNLATNDSPVLPPPTRTVTTTAPPAPVSAPLPPPTRNPVANTDTLGTPPTPMPSYINDMERVYRQNENPEIPAPTRTMTTADMPIATAPDVPLPPPKRVLIGTPGTSAASHVQALQNADPSSKVTKTAEGYEIEPPHKMSRLKAAGKMFLQRMLAGSQYGLGGMLGAGLEGAVEGGVAPGHAQKVMRQDEIERAQGQQHTEQTLEGRDLQNQAAATNILQDQQQILNAPIRQKEAEYERDRSNLEQMVGQADKVQANSPQHEAALAAIQTEADRMSERYGRKVTVIPGEGREPATFSVDGQIAERQPDGSFKTVYGSPKTDKTNEYHDADTDYAYQQKVGEANAKRSAAQLAAQQAKATAEDHQKKVAAAAGTLTNLDAQMAAMPAQVPSGQMMADGVTPKMVANPALGPLKRQREQLKQQQTSAEAAMNAAYKDQRKAEADAAEVYIPPPPPKRNKGKTATGRILPRANLPAAAERLIQQGKIKTASEAEAYIVANGGVVQ